MPEIPDKLLTSLLRDRDRALAVEGLTRIESLGVFILWSRMGAHRGLYSQIERMPLAKVTDWLHRTGVLSGREKNDLDQLRNIRNHAAHTWDQFSWEDGKVVKHLDLLVMSVDELRGTIGEDLAKAYGAAPDNQNKYARACAYFLLAFIDLRDEIVRESPRSS